jgi:uncharacterized membrane protein YciS (DUF1049 family)
VKVFIYLILFVFLFVVAVTLGTQNPQSVTFNYLIAQAELSLPLLLSVFLLLGFVIATLAFGWAHLKHRFALGVERRKNQKLIKENEKLEEQIAKGEVS